MPSSYLTCHNTFAHYRMGTENFFPHENLKSVYIINALFINQTKHFFKMHHLLKQKS